MVLQSPIVLRLCASYDLLPRAGCFVPDRCQERHCHVCQRPVHYDPTASIPVFRPFEVIVCQREECWGRYVRQA